VTRFALQLWLFALATSPASGAERDDFGVCACRRGNTLDVWSQVSQDEGGTTTRFTRWNLADGGVKSESSGWPPPSPETGPLTDGGLPWPRLTSTSSLDWGEAGCRPLRPVRLRLDARLVPAVPGAHELDALERDGTVRLRSEWLWGQPLERRLEVRIDGGVVTTLDLSLAAGEVALEGYDVGDRKHLLLAASWLFTHHEGAPVGDLAVWLAPIDASGFASARDGGASQTVVLPRGTPVDVSGWAEATRWAEVAAQGLEARHAPRAPQLRALANRRHRQQQLAATSAFLRAQSACAASVTHATHSGPERWRPLVAAVFALRDSTRAAEWPLVVERLDWNSSSCGDALQALPLDGGSELTLYGDRFER
jgi:hypothetical protein